MFASGGWGTPQTPQKSFTKAMSWHQYFNQNLNYTCVLNMLKHGANLPTPRESQVAKLRSLARVCRPITEEMKRILAASRPPSVRAVRDCMNVAFALVLAKALQWPHYWIGRTLLLGFPITGVMESTGVLRPRDEPRKVEEFDWLRADILSENKRWLYAVHEKATSRVSSVQDRVNKNDRESLETLQRVERQTLIEIGKGQDSTPDCRWATK